jgi:hypothetical protein
VLVIARLVMLRLLTPPRFKLGCLARMGAGGAATGDRGSGSGRGSCHAHVQARHPQGFVEGNGRVTDIWGTIRSVGRAVHLRVVCQGTHICDPGVLQHLLGGQAVGGVHDQQPQDEVFGCKVPTQHNATLTIPESGEEACTL